MWPLNTTTHLLHVLQNHVGMTVKRLDTGQELLVVSQGDEDLALVTDGLLQDREGALGDLPLLKLADLRLVELGFWDGLVLAVWRQRLMEQKGSAAYGCPPHCEWRRLHSSTGWMEVWSKLSTNDLEVE